MLIYTRPWIVVIIQAADTRVEDVIKKKPHELDCLINMSGRAM